jgi:hypothetical protein
VAKAGRDGRKGFGTDYFTNTRSISDLPHLNLRIHTMFGFMPI